MNMINQSLLFKTLAKNLKVQINPRQYKFLSQFTTGNK